MLILGLRGLNGRGPIDEIQYSFILNHANKAYLGVYYCFLRLFIFF